MAESAETSPDRVAVEIPPSGAVTFRELDKLSDRLRDRLAATGVKKSDRVGICLRKSIDAYASMLGIMKAGAAYVPVDFKSPARRGARILSGCAAKAVIIESALLREWRDELDAAINTPVFIELEGSGDGSYLSAALDKLDSDRGAPDRCADRVGGPDDLAYILYTSGSTGDPKGVMLSHRSAISFVEWCSGAFKLSRSDRFSSHAPFHFDLSILDLYVPLKLGATVVLIDSEQSKDPAGLAALTAELRVTVWYSTPTALTMMYQYGKMEKYDYSSLRYVLFAGEVFPVKHLHSIKQILPQARFVNLYGPTETNVCMRYDIPERVDAGRAGPYPIGKACGAFRSRVVDPDGADVPRGAEGELIVSGPGVMLGYWGEPERTSQSFLVDSNGLKWYKTGDWVSEREAGVYTFAGRRDRMVKRRGYRIELGEIESGLYRHENVREAAVVAVSNAEGEIEIKAYLACKGPSLSVVELKQFCLKTLPHYMSPDVFIFLPSIPMTSTDKVDYQRLARADCP